MSKLWLLLLLGVAFQAVHSYPTFEDDYLEDPAGMLDIVKDTMGKLKDRYKQMTKEGMQKIITKIQQKVCKQQEDFEEDFAESDEEKQGVEVNFKIVKDLIVLLKKMDSLVGAEREKIKQRIEVLRKKICDFKLEDGEDEERGINWGKWGNKVTQGLKKGLKKLGSQMKKVAKKGAKLLKDNAVKVTPLECEGKSCKSCVSIVAQSVCMKFTLSRTNKNTYLLISFDAVGNEVAEHKIALGDVPSCVNAGGVIGKLCLKAIEGKAKSSKGQGNVNFCLAVLAEKYGVGCKFCATYENKKLKVKFSPKMFAGGISDDGDIVAVDKSGDNGLSLDADEFEID